MKLVYETLLRRRGVHRRFPKERYRGVVRAINGAGVPVLDWLRAQFHFLDSRFCRRAWGVAYPPVNVVSGPRALYRYRVWVTEYKGDQTDYLREMGLNLELHRRNGEL